MQQGTLNHVRGMKVDAALILFGDEGETLEEILLQEAKHTRIASLHDLWADIDSLTPEQLQEEALRLEACPETEKILPGLNRGERLNAIYERMAVLNLII